MSSNRAKEAYELENAMRIAADLTISPPISRLICRDSSDPKFSSSAEDLIEFALPSQEFRRPEPGFRSRQRRECTQIPALT